MERLPSGLMRRPQFTLTLRLTHAQLSSHLSRGITMVMQYVAMQVRNVTPMVMWCYHGDAVLGTVLTVTLKYYIHLRVVTSLLSVET